MFLFFFAFQWSVICCLKRLCVFEIIIGHRRNSAWPPQHVQWDGHWWQNTGKHISDVLVMDAKHNRNINILLTQTICCQRWIFLEERSSLNYKPWWIYKQAALSLTSHTPLTPLSDLLLSKSQGAFLFPTLFH